MISALSRRNGLQRAFGTGSVQRIVVVAGTCVRTVRSGVAAEAACGAVHALRGRRCEMSENFARNLSFGRPTVSQRSTLDKVFCLVLPRCVGTGRHPGPLYGVTALDLALAAWFAAQVGELHALA
jgi:hypothetical protein